MTYKVFLIRVHTHSEGEKRSYPEAMNYKQREIKKPTNRC